MVQIKKHPRNNRADYFAPISYIDSSNVVSGASTAALNTSESISCRSVPFTDMIAHWTGLGSISTGNEYERHASECSLVLDETSQLFECPRTLSVALSLSNRSSGSDAIEIFKGDHSSSVFSFSDNVLGNNMINVAMESSFPAREFLEMPFSTSGLGFLEVGTEFSVLFSSLVNLLSAKTLPIIISSDIDNSQVNTESANSIELGRLRCFYNNSKIKNTISQDKVCLTPDPVQPCSLIFSYPDRDFKPAVEGKNRNSFKSSPRKDSLVINNSSIRAKFRFDRFISFISFGNLGYCADSMLGGKTELFPHVTINKLLEFEFVSTFNSKGSFRNVVARFVKPVHSFKKNAMLLFGSIKFNHQRLQHGIDNSFQWLYNLLSWEGGVRFLPIMNNGASATPAPQRN